MSMLKLLQEELEHNPNPVGIDAFLRMAKTIRRAWSVLLRRGKAPTRKAHDGRRKATIARPCEKEDAESPQESSQELTFFEVGDKLTGVRRYDARC